MSVKDLAQKLVNYIYLNITFMKIYNDMMDEFDLDLRFGEMNSVCIYKYIQIYRHLFKLRVENNIMYKAY